MVLSAARSIVIVVCADAHEALPEDLRGFPYVAKLWSDRLLGHFVSRHLRSKKL